MYRYFNLNKFHESTFLQKPYCGIVVKYLNKRSIRNNALEIGCGTGDILLNLNFQFLNGYDKNNKVLKVIKLNNNLKLFRKKNLVTKNFDFSDKDSNIEGIYDVVILCNFTHKFTEEFLKNKVEQIYQNNLNEGGELIIDVLNLNPYYLSRRKEKSYEKGNIFETLHNIDFLNNDLKGKKIFLGQQYLYPFKKASFSKYKREVFSIKKI